MAKSGLKKVTKLRKYINGRPTDETKDNTVGTDGYIPNTVSKEECPVGCDTIVEGVTLVQGTTTTSTTTTTAAPVEPILGRTYSIVNNSFTDEVVIQYTDAYGDQRTETVSPNTEEQIDSIELPRRQSGAVDVDIEPDSSVTVFTTTTTTQAPVSTNDFTIDLTSSSDNAIISVTPPGATEEQEVEIPAGSSVSISSDTTPSTVSGTPSITDDGSITFEEDTYTITNNDYYDLTVVDIRRPGSITDSIPISPRETVEIVSQDIPQVRSGATDVSITAAGNPATPKTLTPLPNRICDQHDLYNDSDYQVTFDYRDCDQLSNQVTLEPREQVSVSAINTPTISSDTPSQVGNSYAVNRIQNPYGTSGTAQNVTPTTTTTTTVAPTTTTTTQLVNPYDHKYGEAIELTQSGNPTDTKSRWYPKVVRVAISKRTGTFKFISYDRKTSGMTIYRVYEGEPEFAVNPFQTSLVDNDSAMRLNIAVCSDTQGGVFQNEGYLGLADEPTSVAQAYAYGNKRKEPVIVKGFQGPFGYSEKTEFTLNKTTNTDYITIRIYQPYHAGLAGTSAVSYVARFEITDVE